MFEWSSAITIVRSYYRLSHVNVGRDLAHFEIYNFIASIIQNFLSTACHVIVGKELAFLEMYFYVATLYQEFSIF